MKNWWLTYILMACGQWLWAQDTLNGKKLLAENVISTAIDPLQQIYFINQNKQLIKLSSIQDKEYVYSDLMIDANTSIHAQNAFKVILYKKDVGDLIVLDNRLTVTARLNFFDLGYFAVSGMTMSNDNHSIWLFDEERQQIIKLDQQNRQVYQSNNLTQVLPARIHPVQIIEQENKLYLLDKKQGIYIFDNTGNFIKQFPIEQADRIWVLSGQIYFYRAGQIWQYDLRLFEEIPLYKTDDYKSIDLCRDFILGITSEGNLYRFGWE